MGEDEPSSGGLVLMPNGLLPHEAASVMRVLDSERWSKAEDRTADLIACIQPNLPSEDRRNAVADYVQRLVTKCFPCQVFTFGSVPLKTYLPDGDIDLTAFCKNTSLKESWAHQVRDILESEEKNENAEFRVKEVQYIQAEVKLIKCLVENIVVDISFNQLGGLCTLCFLDEVDHEINQNHLFKRSIILIKAWCYYESRVLGAHHGLISTYALETLVLYIFHVFNNSFAGPLEVLYRFLEFFSKFDWENFCVSLWGPVPISSLPDVTAEPPRKDGGDLLLSRLFDACSSVYAVFPGGQENQGQPFVTKHFNVIDPLRINNNLGRSVSKGNFFRIRSAFAFGAKRLARLLECPKEDLYFEVNQFFMNTWDRHGNGQRPDAPTNDLWNLRLSNHEQLNEPESIRKNTSCGKNRIIQETQDNIHGSSHLLSQLGSSEFKLKASDASTIARIKTQKNCENTINSKSSDPIKKETSNVGVGMDKVQRSLKPDNVANEIHGRFLFARTRSSPELSDAYDEVSSLGNHRGNPESGKNQTSSTRLDKTKWKNQETDNMASNSTRPAVDPLSVRHVSSRQNLEDAVDSRIISNSYQDEAGLRAMNNDFATISGAQGMHQEEQDLVNILASSAAHGFNGPVHVPLNLASHHLPLPIPSSILASMGYSQRSMGGMVPANFPMIENPWGPNLPFPQGVVPSNLTHYFPGMGMTPPGPEDHVESGSESFASADMNSRDADHGFWHEQDGRTIGGHDLDNGGFEMLQSDDKQPSTSSRYSPSPRVGNTGGSTHGQHKFPKETTRGSAREDHADDFHYLDNRGNEGCLDDRTASSRSVSASHAGSMRSKTSSESSWEGTSAKVSKSSREKRGRRTSPFSVPSTGQGKDKSVSEHSSTQADDDSRDWNVQSPVGTEVAERGSARHPSSSWQVVRHQLPGFEQAQTSESDSVIPFSPIVLNSHSRQRNADSSGVPPFTFYATGPPVPFVTVLPVYNFPTEPGSSDASTSQFSREETVDNSNSGQNFDSLERLDQHDANASNSVKMDSFLELPKHKPDILNSDFNSHWQNLQFGRFCQDTRHPTPMPYSQTPVTVPPGYLQGRLHLDGPGRPIPPNMNIFTQIMSYGPHIVPVAAPLQTLPNRPTGVYQRYVEDMPRIRSGTGTYLPNPKVSVRERHSSGTRRGNYTFDRNDHHGDREGNWNVNSKSRTSGRGYSRSHSEKSNARVDRLAGSESRSERPWSSHRHDSSYTAYQSQNGPVRANSSVNANSPYGTYPLPAMNHGGVSSNGPNMPSVVMIYPYNNNTGYGTHPDQLEFGSLGPMGFSGSNEVSQLNEGSRMSGAAFEDQRFHVSSAQQSPDQPSSPHCIQR